MSNKAHNPLEFFALHYRNNKLATIHFLAEPGYYEYIGKLPLLFGQSRYTKPYQGMSHKVFSTEILQYIEMCENPEIQKILLRGIKQTERWYTDNALNEHCTYIGCWASYLNPHHSSDKEFYIYITKGTTRKDKLETIQQYYDQWREYSVYTLLANKQGIIKNAASKLSPYSSIQIVMNQARKLIKQ